MNKIGYVLSGGGARGFAHLGVIKYLEELGIKPHAIAGTSAGAIAGALYAAGKSPEEILQLLKKSNYFGWSNLLWRKNGFFSMHALYELLKTTIADNDFEAVKIKLFVAATDLVKGDPVILSSGKLFEAVIASASIPVVFEPVVMGDQLLVDGGVLNNFPAEPLQKICDVIIGSSVNKLTDNISTKSVLSAKNIIDRCFHMAIASAVHSKKKNCDVFIESPLHDFDMYDVRPADKIFEIGYNTAALCKAELLAAIKKVAKKEA
ncbi:MAG: patatin [Ferruginibacter sp.]|uniref:patatin-like phospholipase family protein n=1 Tax=Ferruginibacter sp. TaxID=1940288 RepID=UPI0026581255|nr:patatin-like phospholipase family protein [Ferruginibacter sp.]MDB5277519.1 patatin [Ferruginibacter sp.]